MKKVLLGISGSIAAYKSADIAAKLIQNEIEVHVVMTQNATKLITPLTFQSITKNPVRIQVMQDINPKNIEHISLSDETDLFLIAPATANICGKIANGIADDMLSTLALSTPESTPKLIAPAMNDKMYSNPIFRQNLEKLKQFGWHEIEPKTSWLACGDRGKGALQSVDLIVKNVLEQLNLSS